MAARHIATIHDDPTQFLQVVQKVTCSFDLLNTTGAVSKGRWDFIPSALSTMSAIGHFHHVVIRPGHPILFASISTQLPIFVFLATL